MKYFFIGFLILFGCTACYWHLRNPDEVPPQLKVLYLDANTVESHFHVQLLDLLQSMKIHLVKSPQESKFTLHAYDYSLEHDNPPVSSTNVAITYTYTLRVTVSITDAHGKIIVPAHLIIATRQVTVNTNQIFTINATSVFQQELQREATNLIYYWLTSDQIRHQTATAHATQSTTIHPAS
jgi:LPS-assembly lipoprotein